jgi:hypothetical protein
MKEVVFEVLPARKRMKAIQALVFAVLGAGAGWLALSGQGWAFWVLAGLLIGMAVGKLISLARMRYVAKVDASGVSVCLPTGREMRGGWSEIEAHTIDPARGLGGVVLRAGGGGRVRILPVATRDMGADAAERLIATLKERLPKLEYRVPSLGARKR